MVVRVWDLALRESAENPAMWTGLELYPDHDFQFETAIVASATSTMQREVRPIYGVGSGRVQYLEAGNTMTTITISGHFINKYNPDYQGYTFVNHTLDCGWVVPLDSLRTWFTRENLL